jgi:hypothetical protein
MKRRKPPSKRRRIPEPATPEEMFRKAVQMIVARDRQFGCSADSTRRDVAKAIKDALEGEPETTLQVEIDGQVETCINDPGLFRLVMDQNGIDRHDLRAQEKWFAVVQDELAKQLGEGERDA